MHRSPVQTPRLNRSLLPEPGSAEGRVELILSKKCPVLAHLIGPLDRLPDGVLVGCASRTVKPVPRRIRLQPLTLLIT